MTKATWKNITEELRKDNLTPIEAFVYGGLVILMFLGIVLWFASIAFE